MYSASNPLNITQRSYHTAGLDLICFSHLRWNFVYQRPQHLMSRAATAHRVIFFEEPLITNGKSRLHIQNLKNGPLIAVPYISQTICDDEKLKTRILRELLDEMMSTYNIHSYLTWYFTPLARTFTGHLAPLVSVYDCMDELSNFKNASKDLIIWENELFSHVDLVFTGGHSLYQLKRDFHPHVYAFPSSVDVTHFAKARVQQCEPPDQCIIPHPRIGYLGVIDERIDLDLIEGVARSRPTWQIIMIGPHTKIDPTSLPKCPNIHYLGAKMYGQLPNYLAGWDLAWMPFAHNEATRYISPTKTPEYLAAGRHVISTSIRDVVIPYAKKGLVTIADDTVAFIQQAANLFACKTDDQVWLGKVDQMLANQSWDLTFDKMWQYIDKVYYRRHVSRLLKAPVPTTHAKICLTTSAALAINVLPDLKKKKGALGA